jgi:hypothetical protein
MTVAELIGDLQRRPLNDEVTISALDNTHHSVFAVEDVQQGNRKWTTLSIYPEDQREGIQKEIDEERRWA